MYGNNFDGFIQSKQFEKMDKQEGEIEVSESADMGEPGVHSTPVNRFSEPSLTESAISEDSNTHSTPTSTKCNSKFDNDVMSFLLKQFNEMKEQNNEMKSNFNEKLKEQNNETKSNFNEKLKEQKNEIKSNFNEKYDKMNSRFDEVITKMNDK